MKTNFQAVKGMITLEAQIPINRLHPLSLQAPTNSEESSVRSTVGEILTRRE